MGALILGSDGGLIPRDVFVTPRLFEVRSEIKLPMHRVILERPEDFAAMMPVRERDFEAWLEALHIGDERAVAWLRRHVARRRAFSPYADEFYGPATAVATAPSGATGCTLQTYGGGAGGGWRAHALGMGGGGGGAGACQSFRVVVAGDQLAYVSGARGTGAGAPAGSGTNGGNSTTSAGTGGFAALAHVANGGKGVNGSGIGNGSGVNGIGGTASGATVNTTGANGVSGNGGSCMGSGGGAGGNVAEYDHEGEFIVALPGDGGDPGAGGGGVNTTVGGGAGDGGRGLNRFSWS